eukprot:1017844-Prymnesium_polylepis.1
MPLACVQAHAALATQEQAARAGQQMASELAHAKAQIEQLLSRSAAAAPAAPARANAPLRGGGLPNSGRPVGSAGGGGALNASGVDARSFGLAGSALGQLDAK